MFIKVFKQKNIFHFAQQGMDWPERDHFVAAGHVKHTMYIAKYVNQESLFLCKRFLVICKQCEKGSTFYSKLKLKVWGIDTL